VPSPDTEPWTAPGPPGSTPLGEEEKDGLLPSWVASRGDLNIAEQQNIADGLTKPRWRRATLKMLLDDHSVRRLHKDLFGQVWSGAGTYRILELNIGVDPFRVSVCVRDLTLDGDAWINGRHPRQPDEVGYRFHHRLVQIHPFPNGNGRHSRAMTDLLVRAMGRPPFTWGRSSLGTTGDTRATYINALRAADGGHFDELARFIRS
jgi:Fic-DOC domain mobile mystery protein B